MRNPQLHGAACGEPDSDGSCLLIQCRGGAFSKPGVAEPKKKS